MRILDNFKIAHTFFIVEASNSEHDLDNFRKWCVENCQDSWAMTDGVREIPLKFFSPPTTKMALDKDPFPASSVRKFCKLIMFSNEDDAMHFKLAFSGEVEDAD